MKIRSMPNHIKYHSIIIVIIYYFLCFLKILRYLFFSIYLYKYLFIRNKFLYFFFCYDLSLITVQRIIFISFDDNYYYCCYYHYYFFIMYNIKYALVINAQINNKYSISLSDAVQRYYSDIVNSNLIMIVLI